MKLASRAPVLLLALGAALLVVAPVLTRPGAAFLCDWHHPDCVSNQWLTLWVARQVETGGDLLHNDRYYWPVGDAPWISGSGSDGFLLVPWDLAFGWPLGMNLHEALILTLNGLAGWAVARALGASRSASLAAVPTATLMLYGVEELSAGRLSQVSFCWLGFFFAAWVRLLEAPSAGRATLAAALFTLTSLFYWFYGFFAAMLGGILWLFKRTPTRPLVVFIGLVVAMLGPFLAWTLANRSVIPGITEAFPNPESHRASFWPTLPFLPPGAPPLGRELPLSTALLAAAALVVRRDRWTLALVVAWLWFSALAVGPRWPGGPYELIYGLAEPLRRLWWPYRHVVVVNLITIALAARAADRWLVDRPAWGWLLALSVPVQLYLQGAPLNAVYTVIEAPSVVYTSLREHPATVLIEPPLAPEVASSEAPLYYQIQHGKALLGGHAPWVERVRPPGWDDLIEGNAFLAELRRLERAELDGRFTFEPTHLRALIDDGVGLLVLNTEYFPRPIVGLARAYKEICDALFGPAISSDRGTWAWDLRRWTGASEAHFTPWNWPAGVAPGGPSQPILLPPEPSRALRTGPSGPLNPRRRSPGG